MTFMNYIILIKVFIKVELLLPSLFNAFAWFLSSLIYIGDKIKIWNSLTGYKSKKKGPCGGKWWKIIQSQRVHSTRIKKIPQKFRFLEVANFWSSFSPFSFSFRILIFMSFQSSLLWLLIGKNKCKSNTNWWIYGAICKKVQRLFE